jgi:choline dehydrogenase-like flavoprotein
MAAREAFDVVVVGGGAAGCVVAARLASSASRSVLLVEAGPDLRAATPDGLRDGWHLEREPDWGLRSEPDERGEVANLWRHKLLGGTSWATRFAVRGSPADYDNWARMGNVGWGFDDVVAFFNRLETDLDFGGQPWHGGSGPIPITRYRDLPLSDVGAAALAALDGVGFPFVDDHNRPGAVGAGPMPMSARGGQRVTTVDAYLPLGHTPPNLTIRAGVTVAEVVFEGARATGVRLLDGSIIEAGWTVLTAGAYASPTILMRSGIGPADDLAVHGIDVRVDLVGVGANLADHPAIDIECASRADGRTAPILHTIATFHSEHASRQGPPDLMLWLSDPVGGPGEQAMFAIDAVLMKPESRGSVRLRSADPSAPPLIHLPALDVESDVERLAEAFLRAREVIHRPEVAALCERFPDDIHDLIELRRSIRANRYSLPHVVGTCAMGPSPDHGAVVDVDGSVHGTGRLSVVDASIMPEAPAGFPHIPTIMIAERLAERIGTITSR